MNGRLSYAKKGAAIELAIMVLMVSSAFCIILLSTVLMLNQREKNAERQFREKLQVQQTAEDFLYELRTNPSQTPEQPEGCTLSTSASDGKTVHALTVFSGGKARLRVTAEVQGGTVTVTEWGYPYASEGS